jgi:hypothetical protein
MPPLRIGRWVWHIASDDIPAFAATGGIFHIAWILLIGLTGQSILHMPKICHHQGKQWIAVVAGLLGAFLLGFAAEVLLIWEGCKGE